MTNNTGNFNSDFNNNFHNSPYGVNNSELPMAQRRLHRSATDSFVAGVLGGVAETYGINSTLVRVLFIASFFLPGPQILLYIAMWILMPRA